MPSATLWRGPSASFCPKPSGICAALIDAGIMLVLIRLCVLFIRTITIFWNANFTLFAKSHFSNTPVTNWLIMV
jgi:hypothetical protein